MVENQPQNKGQASTCPDTVDSVASKDPGRKDLWDVFEILARPISATVTAVAIAALGYYGQRTITQLSAQNQERITAIAAQEQDSRLYTELLSRREQSESLLRKDMFSVILKDFFKETNLTENPQAASAALSQKLLKLELLALNFGDSLSLGPLFLEIKRDIEKAVPSESEKFVWNIKKKEHEKRLHSLAKRVASAQLAAIKLRGVSQTIQVDVDRIVFDEEKSPSAYTWPDDQYRGMEGLDAATVEMLINDEQRLTLEGVTWVFSLQFSNARFNQKTVEVFLKIYEQAPDGALSLSALQKSFTLDYFNFPLIDNTRLPNNQRFALVMTDFFEDTIQVEGVLFPAVYSSQRDKPYLNEVLEELRSSSESAPNKDEK